MFCARFWGERETLIHDFGGRTNHEASQAEVRNSRPKGDARASRDGRKECKRNT